MENNFTDITDEELDRQIQQTLDLTPYSGETYIRGSLKGRGINVQRFRIRESLKKIDGVGRAVRRRYAISLEEPTMLLIQIICGTIIQTIN